MAVKQNAINNATQSFTIDPGASGDSFVQFDINAVNKFRIGIDDSDSDKFKISSGTALGTNDTFVVAAAGEITKPLQPAFLAVLDADIANVTGDGTAYTVVWDTEVFDQNADFNGTTTFTAPVTGKYTFDVGICFGDIGTHNQCYIQIITSNRSYLFCQANPANIKSVDNELGVSSSITTDMDASDTTYIIVVMVGSTKVIDILTNGATDTYSWFSGSLEC